MANSGVTFPTWNVPSVVAVPPSRSVTDRTTRYAPLSSGVKVKVSPAPAANGTAFLNTCQVNPNSSAGPGSVADATRLTGVPSRAAVGRTSGDSDGARLITLRLASADAVRPSELVTVRVTA